MQSDKPAASLTANLLARKGQARPAMRPGVILGDPTRVIEPTHHPDRLLMAEDVMAPPRQLTKPSALTIGQVVAAVPAVIVPETSEVAPGKRAAFTLRLDSARHLRLRLLCAHQHRSAQQIVIEALDAWLATHPIALTKDACLCRDSEV